MGGTRVVVIGAGVVGAAVARELATDGRDVVVLDRGALAGGTTAHGEGNVLVSDKGPGAELELAQLSRRLWPDVVAELGAYAAGVEWDPKGGIVVATTAEGAGQLAEFVATQRAAGVRVEDLDEDALARAEPQLTREVTAAAYYPEDGQVQPVGAAVALLADARRHGARIRPEHDVTAALGSSERITGVRTTGGEVPADVVINAAGPWSGEVAERLGVRLNVRPRRGEVLVTAPVPPTVFHKVYDADYVGAVGSDSAELQVSTVVESTWGGTLLLGSSRRQIGFCDRARPDVLAAIAAGAVRLYPGLADVSVMRAYGGFRPYVPDHLPVIGADPRLPGLWHATGHEGAGIGLSVGTGRLVGDLVAGRTPELDPEPFRVGRPAVIEEGESVR